MKQSAKIRIFAALLLSAALFLSSCGSAVPNTVRTGSDVYGSKVGILSGSAMECYSEAGAFRSFTDRGTTFQAYDAGDELVRNLKAGTCDCAVTDSVLAEQLKKQNSGVRVMKDLFMSEPYCIMLAKENVDLKKDVNKAIAALTEDGTITAIAGGYLLGTGYQYASAGNTDGGGTITLAVDGLFPPYSYRDGSGQLTGIDVDIARAVCDKLGVGLKLTTETRENMITCITDGTAEIAMDRFMSNETDLQVVDFTDPYYTNEQAILVRK